MRTQPLSESPEPIRGTGGGLADFVTAPIENPQGEPTGDIAQVSEGEFIWPADIVSYMGNGSSEAGARVLNGVVEQVRKLMSGETSEDTSKSPRSLSDVLKG
jgi:hypothetical protein